MKHKNKQAQVENRGHLSSNTISILINMLSMSHSMGLVAQGYVEQRFSTFLSFVTQRQSGYTRWLPSAHIQTMSS